MNEAKEMNREVRKAYGNALVESFPNTTIRDPYYLFDAMQDIEDQASKLYFATHQDGTLSLDEYVEQTDKLATRAAEILGIGVDQLSVTNDPRGAGMFIVLNDMVKGTPIYTDFAGHGVPAPRAERLREWMSLHTTDDTDVTPVRPYRVTVEARVRKTLMTFGENEEDAEGEACAEFDHKAVGITDDYSEDVVATEVSPTELEIIDYDKTVHFDFDDECLYISGEGECVLRDVWGPLDIAGKVEVKAACVEGGVSVGQDAKIEVETVTEDMDVGGNAKVKAGTIGGYVVARGRGRVEATTISGDISVEDEARVKAVRVEAQEVSCQGDGVVMADAITTARIKLMSRGFCYGLEDKLLELSGMPDMESNEAQESLDGLGYFLEMDTGGRAADFACDPQAWKALDAPGRLKALQEYVDATRGISVSPESASESESQDEGVKV